MSITTLVIVTSMLAGACAAAHAQAPAAAAPEPPAPAPKIFQPAEGAFPLGSSSALLVGRDEERRSSQLASALASLQARMHAGQPARLLHALPASGYVLIGLAREHAALRSLRAAWHSRFPGGELGAEGYLIDVLPARILVTADTEAGLHYGILRLVEQQGDAVPAGITADWPALKWRGLHVMMNGRASIPAVEGLLQQYLPHRRMNTLILEIDYNYQWKSHPEMSDPNGLSFDDCRHLSDVARSNFIRIIPQINCLGHQSWAQNTLSLLTKHPEFDETPDVPADNHGIYCRSWCPSNPEVYKAVDALFDELIDAFHADAVHVGMDEVFILGQCPRCKGTDNATLFSTAVLQLHDHLVGKRKVQMFMWGDRLLDMAKVGYGEWEASANGTAPAIDRIPKDIVICDWHYEDQADFPSIPYFEAKGLQVWPSGWNRTTNVRNFTACAFRNPGPDLYGYLATTWSSADQIMHPQPERRRRARAQPNGQPDDRNLPAAIDLGAKIAWEGEAR